MLWLRAAIFLCFITLGYGGPVWTQDITLRVISIDDSENDVTRLTCKNDRFSLYENIPTRIYINSGFIHEYKCYSIEKNEPLHVTAFTQHVQDTFVAEVQNVFASKFACLFFVNKDMKTIEPVKYKNGTYYTEITCQFKIDILSHSADNEVEEAVTPYGATDGNMVPLDSPEMANVGTFDTSSTMKQEEPTGGGHPQKYLGPVAGGATVLLILLVILLVFLKLRRRKLQKNYTNFSNSNPNSKSKTNVNTLSDYAVPEYTLPYNQKLEEMYAQPNPKNGRDENKAKEVTYAEIEFSKTHDNEAGGPKIRGLGAVECVYAELISNKQDFYANVMPKVTRDNEFKSSMNNKEFLEPNYCNVGTLKKTKEGLKN